MEFNADLNAMDTAEASGTLNDTLEEWVTQSEETSNHYQGSRLQTMNLARLATLADTYQKRYELTDYQRRRLEKLRERISERRVEVTGEKHFGDSKREFDDCGEWLGGFYGRKKPPKMSDAGS